MSTQAIAFNTDTLGPAVVNGVFTSTLYGFVAVAMVLSYRVSRTIAFVHGGIMLGGASMFWFLTAKVADNPGLAFDSSGESTFRPELPLWPTLLILLVVGAAIAAFYGYLITATPIALYPKVTLTNLSLAFMLILVGLLFKYNLSFGEQAASPFGDARFTIGVQVVTVHQLIMLILLGVLVTGLAIVMQRTRFGVCARAVADNVEASRLVGVPIARVGVGVYAVSGAVAALGGVLLGYVVGTDAYGVLAIFLRALMVCVIGAFCSVPLALVGAVVVAVVDAMLKGDVFGTVDSGVREFALMGLLVLVVLLIDRFGRKGTSVLAE